MVKKTKKNRFNKTVDVDVVYSSNTIAEVDPTDALVELNLSKEKAEELQKIRAKLPSFSQPNSLEKELAKLPTEKPFRAFVHNMVFSATESDVAKFFAPLEIVSINLVGSETGPRGFCFVDFATREDLAKALERNDSPLCGRPLSVRIADPNTSDRGGFGRDRYGGGRRGGGGYDRSRPYRPASLRNDELPESGSGGAGEWQRGSVVGRASNPQPSFGFSRPAPSETTATRPRINLLPRTAPQAIEKGSEPYRDPKIFGSAKPVDTAAKDREIEGRLNNHPQ